MYKFEQRLEFEPAAKVLTTWLNHYYDLASLPDRHATMSEVIEADIPAESHSGDEWAHSVNSRVNKVNSYRARCRIYESHGWPDGEFDRQASSRALENFLSVAAIRTSSG